MNEQEFKTAILAIRSGNLSASSGNELSYWTTLNQVREYILSQPERSLFIDELIDILQSMFKNLPKID